MQSELDMELQRLCAPLGMARVDQLMKQGRWLGNVLEDYGWPHTEVIANLMRFRDGMLMAAPWAVPVSLPLPQCLRCCDGFSAAHMQATCRTQPN